MSYNWCLRLLLDRANPEGETTGRVGKVPSRLTTFYIAQKEIHCCSQDHICSYRTI